MTLLHRQPPPLDPQCCRLPPSLRLLSSPPSAMATELAYTPPNPRSAMADLANADREESASRESAAATVEGKSPDEVRQHYEMLVEDVDDIEACWLPLLVYAGDDGPGDKGLSKSAEQERRKGISWTHDEYSTGR